MAPETSPPGASPGILAFVDALQAAFAEAGVRTDQCEFHETSGQLVVAGDTTRVVPVAALFQRYSACSASDRSSFLDLAVDAFVRGAADVPADYDACGRRLLPQLWAADRIRARQRTLPQGHDLPHCGLHGEAPPLQEDAGALGVVLVCEYLPERTSSSEPQLPAIETPVLSSDLARWGVTFVQAMKRAHENLRLRTKEGLPADKRWEHHPTGCAQSCQRDRFDAARCALFPRLIVQRKRPDGSAEAGGHVVAFATGSCVLASTSKNPLGLCFMGDTLHLRVATEQPHQLLSAQPYRLLKMKDPAGSSSGAAAAGKDAAEGAAESDRHPLDQVASPGFVWRWLPYAPGGPPLNASGEFSVPVDQAEVDAILEAAQAGKEVPVFRQAPAGPAQWEVLKERGNTLFKAGEHLKAIVAYDAALAAKPTPPDTAAAILHGNAAQALLSLAAKDDEKREGCAAEAMRRALLSVQLDPTYAKGHARCAAACDLLGEPAAAAEARAKAEEHAAAKAAADAAERKRQEEARQREVAERKAAADVQRRNAEQIRQKEAAREALLERERALEREAALAAEGPAAKVPDLSGMLGIDAKLAGIA